MNKVKLLFFQTVLISAAIFFAIGIQMLFEHLSSGTGEIVMPWFVPLTIILTGFLCALPTMLLIRLDDVSPRGIIIRIVIHFIVLGCVVSGCGYVFRWYTKLSGYIPILIMYVAIYVLTWVVTWWMVKTDERKINAAINEIRDSDPE